MSKRSYSDETKAAAMAALLTGQSVSSVAREYKIPKGTVSNWKRKAEEEAAGVQTDRTQKDAIGSLLVDYLEESLKSLRSQSKLFGDSDWLRKQSASELAVLHGVMTDKAVRLLEALGAPQDGGDAS